MHLVTRSVAAYAANSDWQSPLSSALMVDPTVDRAVGGNHPVATWTLPTGGQATSTQVPMAVTVYVDGRVSRYVPPLTGPHLVQVVEDGALRSMYGTDIPSSVVVDFFTPTAPPSTPPDSGLEAADSATQSAAPPDETALEDLPSTRKGKGLVLGGLGAALVGGGAAGAAWGVHKVGGGSKGPSTGLVIGNVAGTAAMVGGLAVAAVGGVRLVRTGGRTSMSLSLMPFSTVLSGEF